MASGAKLPNTNLNLIQDSDVIDNADINAIAQAVEANATDIDALYPRLYLPNGIDLHTVEQGVYSLGATGQYVNGIGGMYGVLKVVESSPRKFLTFHNHTNRVYVKAGNGTSWTSWTEITPIPVEAVLTADKFSTEHLKLYRIGRLCVTTGYFRMTEPLVPRQSVVIGSVPVGFRPPVAVLNYSPQVNTNDTVQIQIRPDGEIRAYNYHGTESVPPNGGISANLMYITND